MCFNVLSRNRPCSSCVLRGKSLLCLTGFATGPGRVSKNIQERSRHAIKAQMVNLSLGMMREWRSTIRILSLFTKDASNVDPSTEIARIRHSLSLLEGHILLRGASGTPTQESSPSYLPTFVPTPSPSTTIDSSVKENIPGTYGRHGHRGYYAGPTSAASHLLMVSQNLGFFFFLM